MQKKSPLKGLSTSPFSGLTGFFHSCPVSTGSDKNQHASSQTVSQAQHASYLKTPNSKLKTHYYSCAGYESSSALIIWYNIRFTGVSIPADSPARTTAPPIASISVVTPRRASCSIDEWLRAVW